MWLPLIADPTHPLRMHEVIHYTASQSDLIMDK